MFNIRILCPPMELNRIKIIKEIVNSEFLKWCSSDALQELCGLFVSDAGFLYVPNDIRSIYEIQKAMAPIWDYRKMQRKATTSEGEAARWLLENNEFIELHKDEIMDCVRQLGLVDEADTVFSEVNYVLPLGGARMSNLYRPQLAKRMVDRIKVLDGVVALSTFRPISDSERDEYIDTYAPCAETEFDAMSKGMICAFGIKEDYNDDWHDDSNRNLAENVRQYAEKYNGCHLYATAAPSSNPARRANSADCFEFFFKYFDIEPGAKLLNCTSQIYVPYQQVRALKYAIKYDVEFDTVGYSDNSKTKVTFEPVNYLQEIKGTIDAMCDFINEFKDYIDE